MFFFPPSDEIKCLRTIETLNRAVEHIHLNTSHIHSPCKRTTIRGVQRQLPTPGRGGCALQRRIHSQPNPRSLPKWLLGQLCRSYATKRKKAPLG
jgi:hypothetical protein